MSIPIDEMLTDLREVLEVFDADPSDATFNAVQDETLRIECTCEGELWEATKMNDRELLELAAKAAGIEIHWCGRFPGGGVYMRKIIPEPPEPYSKHVPWDPLTDDGDAFRLSVALDMNVFHAAGCAFALPSDDDGSYEMQVSYSDAGGKEAATRRAIVRAAAEIGKEVRDE